MCRVQMDKLRPVVNGKLKSVLADKETEAQQNKADHGFQLGKAGASRGRKRRASAKVRANKGLEEFAENKHVTEAMESQQGPAVTLHTASKPQTKKFKLQHSKTPTKLPRSAVHQRKKPKPF